MRKVVLLYCQDETQRSVLALLLDLHLYRVIGGISPLPPIPNVILVADDRSISTARMAMSISKQLPQVKLLVIPAKKYKCLPHGYPMNAEMLPWNWLPSYLLMRLRMVVKQRRSQPQSERKSAFASPA